MPAIKKPLLAGNYDESKAKFPYLASPKIDGIRFLMVNGVPVSRSFKPIRNQHIHDVLQNFFPDGLDGELTSGSTFQDSTSAVMTIEGRPSFKVWLFDYVDPAKDVIAPYHERVKELRKIRSVVASDIEAFNSRHGDDAQLSVEVVALIPCTINDPDKLALYEQKCLSEGFEGVMLRDPNGTYKFGRSSTNENILLKVKKFVDDEAVVIGFEEKQINMNEAKTDAFGHTKRSSSKDGLVNAGTLGTILVKNSEGFTFGVGSGLNDEIRAQIWSKRDSYLGKVLKFKHFPQGVKECPRHPVFIGFRDKDDM